MLSYQQALVLEQEKSIPLMVGEVEEVSSMI